MASEVPQPPPQGAGPGLPPVTPPSGRFIAQLFLVPGMIVLVAVLIILGINYLFVSGYTPKYFLAKLDSDNADIRWRGASDLAQVLKRKESLLLRSDPDFALDLVERLHAAFLELKQQEKSRSEHLAQLPEVERDKGWLKLQAQRDHVEYLASALGDFVVPVGAPILSDILSWEGSPDIKGNTMRRRRALWALANLGQNLKAFTTDLAADRQARIVDQLKSEAASSHHDRAVAAATALHYLSPNAISQGPEPTLVDHVLAKAAQADDRYLRAQVALALNFWDGDLVEPTLLKLVRDNGHGTLIRVADGD